MCGGNIQQISVFCCQEEKIFLACLGDKIGGREREIKRDILSGYRRVFFFRVVWEARYR